MPARPRFGEVRFVFRLLLWSVLTAALVFQVQILVRGGVRVPDFVAEHFFREAERQGVSVGAAAVWFDPRGRVLVIAPQVGLSTAPKVVSADAVALQLRRRALLRGELEILRVELTGLNLALPAVYSPSGLDESLLAAGEFRLSRSEAGSAWRVDQASARVLDVPTAFAGIIPASAGGAANRPVAASEETARNGLRRVASIYRRIAELPLGSIQRLRIELGAEELTAAVELPYLLVPGHPLIPEPLVGSTLERVGLGLTIPFADPSGTILRIDAEALSAPPERGLSSGPVALRIRNSGDGALTAQAAFAGIYKADTGLPSVPLVADLSYRRDVSRLEGVLSTRLADAPWFFEVAGDPGARAGEIRADGELSPALLEVVRPFLPEKARAILTLTDAARFSATAEFGAGAVPERIVVRGYAGRTVARRVEIDRAEALLIYEPPAKRFRAEHIVLVQGDARAEGSYEMATDTLAFRFLLGGTFRPMGIAGWFSGWWSGLWKNFTFGDAPPEGSADIQGVWRRPTLTTVFVGARSGPMRLRELALDSLATRLQVNPGGSVDVRGFRAIREGRLAVGSFSRELGFPPPTRKNGWQRIGFDVRADFPIEALPLLFPAEGPGIVAPFALSAPPQIHLVGEVHGPDSTTPRLQRYRLDLEADAPLSYQGFPLDSLKTSFVREGDDIRLRELRAGVAGGLVNGEAALSGPAADRWLAFDLTLAEANLDGVLAAWREFQAARPKQNGSAGGVGATESTPGQAEPAAPAPEAAAKALGGKLHAAVVATGPVARPLGFSGRGTARIEGADLAKIRLLGGFSGLLADLGLGFTTVELTDAKADFAIVQNELRFESLVLSGPSARVDADGIYRLPGGGLEFGAKVRPFEERSGILSSTAGFFLAPLSSALGVELAGTLEAPAWTFTYGPTRLFRSLTGTRPKAVPDNGPPPAAPPAATPDAPAAEVSAPTP